MGVLLRFREKRIAIAGDIESMYHRVKVADQHRNALRFLWWKNGELGGDIEVYRMTSHLFGGIWSSSCANYALRKAAADNVDDFDKDTIQTVTDNFYVDDCLKSVDSKEKGIKLVQNVCDLLQRGGFRLTKWTSNSRTVLQSIPVEERAKELKDINLCDDELPQEKALGVKWDTETDQLGFKFQPKNRPATKRGLLSILTSVYDPIGFLSPLILKAKMIFQDECRLRKGWDTALESISHERWSNWLSKLCHIEDFTVPRCVIPNDFCEMMSAELHHFADASIAGYVAVSQRFWVISARRTIRKVLKDCVKCKRLQGKRSHQKMANLPEDRVTPGKPPFVHTGVDCFGPFLIKRGRSEVKRYGCIFTCLTTRAIHLEKLDSMDTDSFINALRRFEARRGVPDIVRSDNGTNFRGAQNELREAIRAWNHHEIQEHMLQKEIQWMFNPPSASHMGGVWERQIRTVRKVLNALLYQQHGLHDEGLSTLFCEVEAIVNSRPITIVSDSPSDMEPLTPNHILLLRSGNSLPPGRFSVHDTYRRRWKHVQFLADQFWKRWLKEYLPGLQLRQKWLQSTVNLKVGDIVLLVNENSPRCVWPLARITNVFPGNDGLVRSIEVKTKDSVLIRPISKVCLLESVYDA
ncbi:uncharacterized protein [Haliotis cracherodii]|uniref:uncharacterized protein n=1 Tax=Haliotis cracherodii TaxID=6455 RepID=UPI0039ED6D38